MTDNTFNQEVATELLEAVGATAVVANNGREALEHLAREAFDIVLMDVQMPEVDGLEATRRIRANPALSRLAVIALTAHATQDERKACLAVGMDDFLTKPIDPDHLYLALAKWLPSRAPASADLDSHAAEGGPPSSTGEAVESTPDTAEPAAIDLAILDRMVDGDPAMVRRFALLFIETAGEILAEMQVAHTRRDLAALGGLGHKLKSSARTVGATSFADLCQALEGAGKADDWPKAERILSQLPPLLERITRQIEHELGPTIG